MKLLRSTTAFSALSFLLLVGLSQPLHAIVVSGQGDYTDPSDALAVSGVSVNGINHDGVGDIIVNKNNGNFRGTGSLLWSGSHLITAAHVVTNDSGQVDINSGTITFTYGLGGQTTQASFTAGDVSIHSRFNGNLSTTGHDIAIIALDSEVNPFVPRYHILQPTTPLYNPDTGNLIPGAAGILEDQIEDQVFTMFGYGRTGTGNTGDDIGSGTKRFGQNEYDHLAGVNSSVLLYDFDNGLAAQNALGGFNGDANFPLGLPDGAEANSAPGDSGGASFIEDPDNPGEYLIAGIVSYGTRNSFDINSEIDASFGERSGDANVPLLSDWIIETVGVPVIPEPASGSLLLGAGLVVLLRRRR